LKHQNDPAAPYLTIGTNANVGYRKLHRIISSQLDTDVGERVINQNPDTNTPPSAQRVVPQRVDPKPKLNYSNCNHNCTQKVTKQPYVSPRNTQKTRSNTIHDIGTIIRKQFPDGTRQEGEVTHYNSINGLYTIKYQNGETNELNVIEMRRYYKQYSKDKTHKKALFTKYNTTFHYTIFPCAKSQQSIPINKFQHLAMAAGGTIWDAELNKMATYKDFMNHPNTEICERWTWSSKNECARLLDGYNGIDGLNVMEWIAWDAVPKHKKVTYAQYMVAYRPEKAKPYRTRITVGSD
jgi:hypothetical protein